MLQNLRDNLKGAVAIVVIIIFVVPLVLFGVEQLFVGSVGGNDVATVNGEGVSRRDLQRELLLEKNRLQQQLNLEASSPRLDDSALFGPVLDRMVQREAMLQAATKGGMGASKDELWKQIAQIEAFQVDGKFNYDVFKERISYVYTPANFLEASGKDYMLGHLNAGIVNSTFVTPGELAVLAGITQQKRTFFSIEIPTSDAGSIVITDDQLKSFYQSNSAQYLDPESVVIEYVELDLKDLAKRVQVPDADVLSAYDLEVQEFSAVPKYEVAHILLEKKAGQENRVAEVKEKLASGDSFESLAKSYSDDLGSKNKGGDLGLMVEDAFPSEFVSAVKTLKVGGISDPVKTDAGTHFIKLVNIVDANPPSFEERKQSIREQLALHLAQEEYVLKAKTLDEKTFGTDSLQPAAEALNVKIKTSPSFTRRGGVGISENKAVVDAAFADDVLKLSYNSRVISLDGDRSVVLRMKKHQPELLKPFDSVKDQIKERLIADRQAVMLQEKADAIIAELNAGTGYLDVAKASNLEAKLHDGVTRTTFDGNSSVLQKAFSLPRPSGDAAVFDRVSLPGVGVAVLGLTSVKNGDLSSLEAAQQDATKRQLAFQLNRAEVAAFEKAIIDSADIEKSEK